MAKRIASSVGNINDFPDDVLCRIISFLPFKEAVRSSILSKRWMNLSTFLSNLDLEFNGEEEDKKWFVDFVYRLLFYREVPSIIRFRLKTNECINFQKVGLWVFALVWHKIQELDLFIDVSDCGEFFDYPLPPNLFLCESLEVLKLDMCWDSSKYEFPSRICLPCLKVLHWKGTIFPNDGSEERLFSSCPVLEDLVLGGEFNTDCTKFKVSNQNLKTLTFKYIISEREVVRILIDAPSLVLLIYYISDKYSIELKGVKFLPRAIIDYNRNHRYLPFIPKALTQIQNVQTLEITYEILQDLQNHSLPIPLFEKMTCLKIQCKVRRFNPVWLEYFLTRCVVLETLVLEECPSQSTSMDTSNQYSLQNHQLAPLLRHLKTIEIQLHDIAQAETIMALIEFFVKNASVLEELKIHAKHGLLERQVEIMRKVTSFPRASTKCSVLFDTLM